MFNKILFCLFLVLSAANAKYYSLDIDMNVQEISDDSYETLIGDPRIVATAKFVDHRNISGWTYYTYQVNDDSPDWLQTFSAGYMEGYLAYDLIYDTWNNQQMYFKEMKADPLFARKVNNFVNSQTAWILQQIAKNPNDNYWNLVNTTMAQVYGMYSGYLVAIAQNHRKDLNLTFEQFYTMTYMSDLFDVMAKFSPTNLKPLKCSFLAKMTNENLFTSHTTWFDYNGLLRTYKILTFNLKNPLVKTKRITFSSQPGYTTSQDDYYTLDNNRFVSETSLSSDNNKVYEYLHYDSIPYWIRIHVANFVYDTPKSWIDAFFAHRSGTYCNQWFLVDFNNYKLYKNNTAQAKDIIWLVEEFYSLTSAQDVTQTLLIPQGYVASYNVPYDPEIQKLSKNPTNYTTDPRYYLFKKYAPGIKTMDDFRYVMRLNNKSDTGDYCQAIAARCDLSDKREFPNGALDCKATSDTMITNHQSWIIAGPTSENLPPFTWEHYPEYNHSRAGIPTLWNFSWVFLDPNTNFTSAESDYSLTFESDFI